MPEHEARFLCSLTQGREQVWMPQRGQVYLGAAVWQIAQRAVRGMSADIVWLCCTEIKL
jgi:hypothetical protein